MKILVTENQLKVLVEQEKGEKPIRTTSESDPWEYQVQNGVWFTRKKGKDKWINIDRSKNPQLALDILNKQFPDDGGNKTPSGSQVTTGADTSQTTPTTLDTIGSTLGGDVNSKEFKDKLQVVAKNLGFKTEWLLKIMKKESGMNPHIENKIGCVGLIQFCPDKRRGSTKTIGLKTYNLQDVKNMDAVGQLDVVEAFYRPYARKINSYTDLYLFTFFPKAFGKPDDYVIGGEGNYASKISSQNPKIARAAGKMPGEPLTVADFKDYAVS